MARYSFNYGRLLLLLAVTTTRNARFNYFSNDRFRIKCSSKIELRFKCVSESEVLVVNVVYVQDLT